jgi:hypothetical protein
MYVEVLRCVIGIKQYLLYPLFMLEFYILNNECSGEICGSWNFVNPYVNTAEALLTDLYGTESVRRRFDPGSVKTASSSLWIVGDSSSHSFVFPNRFTSTSASLVLSNVDFSVVYHPLTLRDLKKFVSV